MCSVSAVFTTGAARGLEQWSVTVPTQWLQVQAAVGLGSAGPGKLSGYSGWRYTSICKATLTENSSYAPSLGASEQRYSLSLAGYYAAAAACAFKLPVPSKQVCAPDPSHAAAPPARRLERVPAAGAPRA